MLSAKDKVCGDVSFVEGSTPTLTTLVKATKVVIEEALSLNNLLVSYPDAIEFTYNHLTHMCDLGQ